jgi:hypothetical protein
VAFDPYEDEDRWIQATDRFRTGGTGARLPISSGMAALSQRAPVYACRVVPSRQPAFANVRLKLVPTLTPEKEALLHTELVAVMNYDRLRADGMSAHEAREAVCKDVAQTESGRERKIMAVLEPHGLTASLEAPTVKLPKKGYHGALSRYGKSGAASSESGATVTPRRRLRAMSAGPMP